MPLDIWWVFPQDQCSMCKIVCCSISIWYLSVQFNEYPKLYHFSNCDLLFLIFNYIFLTFSTIGISKVGGNTLSLVWNIHIVYVRKWLYHFKNFKYWIQYIRSYHPFIWYKLFLAIIWSINYFYAMTWYTNIPIKLYFLWIF